MEKERKFDFFALLLWPFVAAAASFLLEANYLVSILLFLGVPSLFLSWRCHNKVEVEKIGAFSLILGVPGVIATEYVAYIADLWVETTMFSFRLFNFVPLESFLWGFLSIFFPIMFYEYFLHEHLVDQVWYPRMRYLAWGSAFMGFTFMLLFIFVPFKLDIGYSYLLLAPLIVVLPVLVDFMEYGDNMLKIVETGMYFFVLSFVYEFVALKLDLWYFPGDTHYIGMLNFLGVSFPVEEVVFWFIFFAMAATSMYDIWDDYTIHETSPR